MRSRGSPPYVGILTRLVFIDSVDLKWYTVHMNREQERDMGEQPLAQIMVNHALAPRDLVARSTEQLTFKMVTRACKGRRLTPHVQSKILNALNACTGTKHTMDQLFNYVAPKRPRDPWAS